VKGGNIEVGKMRRLDGVREARCGLRLEANWHRAWRIGQREETGKLGGREALEVGIGNAECGKLKVKGM